MTTFYLLRHGEPDFSLPQRWNAAIGWGADIAPLTPRGITQVEAAAERLRAFQPRIILSSPMTRAVQSTLVLARVLDAPSMVEFDLHEWVPDLSFRWSSFEEVLALIADLDACEGEWPAGEQRSWEPLSRVRKRTAAVLARYRDTEHVAVVCHGMVIRSLTGRTSLDYAEIVPFAAAEL